MKEKITDGYKKKKEYVSIDQILAPIMNSFTRWVLDRAKQQGITRLYFFARDGFLPYEIANKIIKQEEEYEDIQIYYFICSRLSLEMAYFYATEYCCFPVNVISNQEIFMSICDLNLQEKVEINQLYENGSLETDYFINILNREAYKQFLNFIDYVKELEVLDDPNFAIVDSGWLGNTQKKILQILDKAGYQLDMKGFYFGLFDYPQDGGTYETYYFSPQTQLMRKVCFNPNLFEAVSSAQTGIALGYKRTKKGNIIPICRRMKGNYKEDKDVLQKRILQSNLNFDQQKINTLIKKLFFNLDKSMLSLLEKIYFSMDVNDSRKKPLLERLTVLEGLSICIPFRFFTNKKVKSIYWLEGSCSYNFNGLYKNIIIINILIWNAFRIIIKDFFKGR